MNRLYFGDNLDVLRGMPGESVSLIYLDPPFNSKASYNVLYGTKRGGPSRAQSHAFEDTWRWGADAQRALNESAARHLEAGALLDAFHRIFGASDMMAYLAMMTVRLIELHRVLKSTGSLYLHCDPTASHYLKLILDAVFGSKQFRSEISWKRSSAHSDAKQGRTVYGNVRDVILFYSKGKEWTWNWQFTPYSEEYINSAYRYTDSSGRRYRRGDLTAAKSGGDVEYKWPIKRAEGSEWLADLKEEWKAPKRGWEYKQVPPYRGRYWAFSKENMRKMAQEERLIYASSGMPEYKRYLDEMPGVPLQNDWADILPAAGRESLGYSTQKPLALLERIIEASSNPQDTILDPFCGCGTAIEAAERKGRKWIGIDVTYLAIHVIEERLIDRFGGAIREKYKLFGRPKDADDAIALAKRDWLEFQKWAVMCLGGLPKDRPGADGGIDGIIRYHRVGIEQPNRGIVQVKGGVHVGVDAIHKLKSVVARERAELGILVCLDPPTAAMQREAASEGEIGPRSKQVSRLQIVTVEKLFDQYPVDIPGVIDLPEVGGSSHAKPRQKASRMRIEGQSEMLFPIQSNEKHNDSRREHKPILNRSTGRVDLEVVKPSARRKGSRGED